MLSDVNKGSNLMLSDVNKGSNLMLTRQTSMAVPKTINASMADGQKEL